MFCWICWALADCSMYLSLLCYLLLFFCPVESADLLSERPERRAAPVFCFRLTEDADAMYSSVSLAPPAATVEL